jgi:hypothetical protein
MSTSGFIGSFYFGPVYESISADTITIKIAAIAPEVITLHVSPAFTLSPVTIHITTLEPTVYYVSDILINFVGVPRLGVSPLIVDFTANVIFGGTYNNKYYVKSYIWYFDYINHPTVYETSVIPTISHVYTGHRGEKFTVKLCVLVKSI